MGTLTDVNVGELEAKFRYGFCSGHLHYDSHMTSAELQIFYAIVNTVKKNPKLYERARKTHTSERLVVKLLVKYGSITDNMPLDDLVSSMRQSHCASSSMKFVAVRTITFLHLIYIKQSLC